MLIKLKDNQEQWQLDLMKTSQRAILARTKEANSGNGSAYPDGFTVDVHTDEDKIALPYHVLVDLTANPKEDPGFPANLESHLDAIVTPEGKYIVTNFKLGQRPR